MRVGLLFLIGSAAVAQVEYTPLSPEVLLPDGTPFRAWSDRTQYTRTYHVAQNHPAAADSNPGSEDRPFRTIGRAAELLEPGERVRIHSGVYREMVQPRAGGTGPDRMIAYEAAPGEHVVISGSRVLDNRWERSNHPRGKRYSRKLWMASIPATLLPGDYNAFALPNATDYEIDLMPWSLEWKGRLPYTLRRALLFEDGRRMAQLATYEDLVRLPGSYFVAEDGKTVHVHPFSGRDPNGRVFEAAVQPHLFKPARVALGFIRVSGLTFERCANSFLRSGVGAVFTHGGHHWLIEGNTVRHVNSVGIEIGHRTFEYSDKRFTQRTDPEIGHTIVRGNRIHDCGTAGIRGLHVPHALVERNYITDSGWQDAEYHWETAGIKLLLNRGTLVRDNHIARLEGGGGIWLDWDNRNSRVTGNLIHDISTAQGAVFVEASQDPNWVDHNIIWNIDGQGVRLADTDLAVVAHNLFMRVAEDLAVARVATDRKLRGRKLTSTGNRVVNNVLVDVAKPVSFGDSSNIAGANVYVSTGQPGAAPVRDAGPHSVVADGKTTLKDCVLTTQFASALPRVPPVERLSRTGVDGQTIPGPFPALAHGGTVKLPCLSGSASATY